jgi:hypothetical protein
MTLITEIFGSGFELYDFLSKKARVRNTTKRLLLREIRNNLKRLEHRNMEGASKNLIIQKLENESVLAAIQVGFDFKKLAPGKKVDSSIAENFKPAKKYIGWNSDKIMLSVDEKITNLKELIEIYDSANVKNLNLTSRLNNLYSLLIMQSILIRNGSK